VYRHVVGRVGERAAKMARLRVVTEQRQRHARHEADVFELLPILWVQSNYGRRCRQYAHEIPSLIP
jgi:hypothetical protein